MAKLKRFTFSFFRMLRTRFWMAENYEDHLKAPADATVLRNDVVLMRGRLICIVIVQVVLWVWVLFVCGKMNIWVNVNVKL